jgi:hypothetical protein
MKKDLSSEASSHSATQEIPNISWNPKVQYFIHTSPQLVFSSKPCVTIRNEVVFNGEEFLAPRTTSKLEAHPLLVVRDCSFSIFATTLHNSRPSRPPATLGGGVVVRNYLTSRDFRRIQHQHSGCTKTICSCCVERDDINSCRYTLTFQKKALPPSS